MLLCVGAPEGEASSSTKKASSKPQPVEPSMVAGGYEPSMVPANRKLPVEAIQNPSTYSEYEVPRCTVHSFAPLEPLNLARK